MSPDASTAATTSSAEDVDPSKEQQRDIFPLLIRLSSTSQIDCEPQRMKSDRDQTQFLSLFYLLLVVVGGIGWLGDQRDPSIILD